ncbi:3-methylmercaptopropionyl-CoA ligase [Alphaproteobacteria bacterium SO-S41]|nr:3-methylmercaptopropionyl-CoA ligase [Alphaproteobacteria bacterium SO-S41]
MQDWPLLVHKVLDHAATYAATREIVTRGIEGPIRRTNWATIHQRSKTLAKVLAKRGIKPADRVATLAWNSERHLESWYGITGAGGVYHTLNPRLFPEQLVYIVNHAEDRMIFVDLTFIPILEKLQAQLSTVETYVVLTDAAHMPATSLKNAIAYEELLKEADADFAWVELDEKDACGLCYTSGTTGNPKGVLYSHRSNVIHAMAILSADGFGLSNADTVLPIVPMFHANAWSLSFSAPMTGAKMVMPGAKLDGESVYNLLEDEQITMSAAVPTVWLMLLQHMEANNLKLSTLKRVAIGGSACPPSMIEKFEVNYGVEVMHAWGMTEMSPVGTLGSLLAKDRKLPFAEQLKIKSKQGRPLFSVEMKITDDEGAELPRDGKTFGHLVVRGPAVSSGYFKGEGGNILDADGFFDTGDVAMLDADGYMQITDRSKDVIKSGGEWISSIDIENIAVGHPAVAIAAVIGVAHPKWDERPLLIVQLKPGADASKEDLLKFLEGKIAKWWMPDDVAFVEAVPVGATGKIQKLTLRETFKGHVLPTAGSAAAE